jgi:pyridoxine 4-dehydrogenase
VEVELSLWSTDILYNDVAKTCAELGIAVVAYSPLGRGVLTGAITKISDLPEGDFRLTMPRFQEEALTANQKLVNEVKALAEKKNVTAAQVALAWIRTLSGGSDLPTIIPIPGATTSDRVIQNTQDIGKLSPAEMEEIDAILRENQVVGSRF